MATNRERKRPGADVHLCSRQNSAGAWEIATYQPQVRVDTIEVPTLEQPVMCKSIQDARQALTSLSKKYPQLLPAFHNIYSDIFDIISNAAVIHVRLVPEGWSDPTASFPTPRSHQATVEAHDEAHDLLLQAIELLSQQPQLQELTTELMAISSKLLQFALDSEPPARPS